MNKSKALMAAALALTCALSAGAAQAGNVQWSISIGMPFYAPPVYVQPVPVYVQPAPVYVQPAPVYVQPLPIYRPVVRVWAPPAPVYLRRDDHRVTRWDHDGDGIPNRHDRLYNPRWDRDGDGIPNRQDRYPGRAWQGR